MSLRLVSSTTRVSDFQLAGETLVTICDCNFRPPGRPRRTRRRVRCSLRRRSSSGPVVTACDIDDAENNNVGHLASSSWARRHVCLLPIASFMTTCSGAPGSAVTSYSRSDADFPASWLPQQGAPTTPAPPISCVDGADAVHLHICLNGVLTSCPDLAPYCR